MPRIRGIDIVRKKLTNTKGAKTPVRLGGQSAPFRMVIARQLDNHFTFKDLGEKGAREFHRFIEETVAKGLSISQVEKLYLRTRGKTERIRIGDGDYVLYHFGKDRQAFRVFGYFEGADFVVTRLDAGHKTHRQA